MRRVENWPRFLAEYIEECRNKPFEWGSHDCVTFANGACAAQTGNGFFNEWGGEACSAKAALSVFKSHMAAGSYDNPLEMIDMRLTRGEGFLARGSIIARKTDILVVGFGLGVVLGEKAAFAGADGLVFDVVSGNDAWWIV